MALAPARAVAADEAAFCSSPFTRDSLLRSDASKDLYNSLLWFAGTAGIEFGTRTSGRWSSINDFDDGLRDGLREDSTDGRRAADRASDALLAVSVGALPLISIGKTLYERDCEQAFDMATDLAESMALTLLVTESLKVTTGRERPYVRSCDGNPPSDAVCGRRDRFESFISGHASLAAAGAGVTCAFSLRRNSWGHSNTARVAPCAFGLATALATGSMRIVADRHWTSDVLVGLGVGFLFGYFDTWGPFDLLRFEIDRGAGVQPAQGVIMPYAGGDAMGARIALRF